MARNSVALLLIGLAGISVAWGDADRSPQLNSQTQIQLALDSLRKGDFEGAELRAKAVLRRDADFYRGWLVIASARQQRKMYEPAVEAYQNFVASCPALELRQFAMEQIDICRQASAKPAPQQPASAGLTPAELLELAKVEKDTAIESSEHFIVRTRNAKLSKLMANQCELMLTRVSRGMLGMQEFPHSVQVYVWTDLNEYKANARNAPEWSGGNFSISVDGGVTTQRIDLTQLDQAGKFNVQMIDRVLPHELCHLVTREFFGDANCPLFLNEGLAMLTETRVDNDRLALAGLALAGSERLPLEALLAGRRDNIGKAEVFYAEAYSFTDFLRNKLGQRQFKDFLDHVRDGCTVADAIQRAICVPGDDDKFLPALAEAWQDQAIGQSQMTRALRGK